MTKYWTQRENETPRSLAVRFKVPAAAIVELNNTRVFGGQLKGTSMLRRGTLLLIPSATGPTASVLEGTVVATNYSLWMVQHDDGGVVELVASEVREACWCHRYAGCKYLSMLLY